MTTFFSRRVAIAGNMAVLTLCLIFFWLPFAMRGARMAIEGMKNDMKDWLPADFPETKELGWFREHFLGEQFVILTWDGCSEDDPQFKLLVRRLRADASVDPDGLIKPPPGYEEDAPRSDGSEGIPSAADDTPAETGASDDTAAPPGEASDAAPPEERGPPAEAPEAPPAATPPPGTPLGDYLEAKRARQLGDKLGLHVAGDLFHSAYGYDEKWLRGDGDVWYYLLPNGDLHRWNGTTNFLDVIGRWVRHQAGIYKLGGERVASFGRGTRADNLYYKNPRKLTARFFHQVTTGPDVLHRLAGEDGPLRAEFPGLPPEEARFEAETVAYQRLQGVLFEPQPPVAFQWKAENLSLALNERQLEELPAGTEKKIKQHIQKLVDREFDGELSALQNAPEKQQIRLWREMFVAIGAQPPTPQTSLLVTLTEPARRDLSRVVGRELLGKHQGRLLTLAEESCGLQPTELKLGGPPIDNVAIDEEGSITLTRLVTYCAIVGLSLAYICFRSFKVTLMIFFIGGMSAMTSMGIVWWCGSTVDAILLTMPALVYVLGISGAVHIVNYYRDAVEESGEEGAPEKAIQRGWFPCTLAAFTTSLGMLSLYASNITPIKKFGVFSALGVMATIILLFTYLPAALSIYPAGYKKREPGETGKTLAHRLTQMWLYIGQWVTRHHAIVTIASICLIVAVGAGLLRINTSIRLLKLFDGDAKIIRDYEYLETHIGRLVPMELVVHVDRDSLLPTVAESGASTSTGGDPAADRLKYNFEERLDIARRVQEAIDRRFGERGTGETGTGMSPITFIPTLRPDDSTFRRRTLNAKLEQGREELLEAEYLREDKKHGDELLRISLRIGALQDVDYGEFVNDLKSVVEPVVMANETRNEVLKLVKSPGAAAGEEDKPTILILGFAPSALPDKKAVVPVSHKKPSKEEIRAQQTVVFCQALEEMLRDRGYGVNNVYFYNTPLTPEQASSTEWADYLARFSCVVQVRKGDGLKLDETKKHAAAFVDATHHQFDPQAEDAATASQRRKAGEEVDVWVTYTGVVPVVYKAQRTLLESLVNSIGLAFVMIAAVMMVLLRDWHARPRFTNLLNIRGGMASMLPNVFPMLIIFGAMGHIGIEVDIGSMMTASVAMGVAVDDTIHFLNWYRMGLRQGLNRKEAIAMSYKHCATAMTQTTAIAGIGLAVFALSTFTPTQRFGVLMFTLLATALVGDLIFLPALLAGPLGKYFGKELSEEERQALEPTGATS